VPGDVVDLQIKRKKNKYAEAEAVKFHELFALAFPPPATSMIVTFSNKGSSFFFLATFTPCQHYGVCGGCKWQVLPYPEQIKYKQKQVEDNLRRIGTKVGIFFGKFSCIQKYSRL